MTKDTSTYVSNWDSDNNPIIIDTAASRTLTPYLSNLKNPKPYKTVVNGLGKGSISHTGTVEWRVLDSEGRETLVIDDEAYCCTEILYRLLSPHSWRHTQNQIRYKNGKDDPDDAQLIMTDDGYALT